MPKKEPKAELKRLRASRGWSQKQMADYLGCDQSTISRIEEGKLDPRGPLSKLIGILARESAGAP